MGYNGIPENLSVKVEGMKVDFGDFVDQVSCCVE